MLDVKDYAVYGESFINWDYDSFVEYIEDEGEFTSESNGEKKYSLNGAVATITDTKRAYVLDESRGFQIYFYAEDLDTDTSAMGCISLLGNGKNSGDYPLIGMKLTDLFTQHGLDLTAVEAAMTPSNSNYVEYSVSKDSWNIAVDKADNIHHVRITYDGYIIYLISVDGVINDLFIQPLTMARE